MNGNKKRKRQLPSPKKKPTTTNRKAKDLPVDNPEELLSSSEGEDDEEKEAPVEEKEFDPYADETPDEKRIRLAKEYLQRVEEEVGSEEEDEEQHRELVAQRLRHDQPDTPWKVKKQVGNKWSGKTYNTSQIRSMKGHKSTVTCVSLSSDDTAAYSGSKDCSIIRWDVESGKRVCTFGGLKNKTKEGHNGHVLAIATSTDGKYLASAGDDKLIKIWDTKSNKLIDSFKGHRDIVSALAFRTGTNQLFSGSHDRTIKIWSVDDMAYADTLYGHQTEITCLDSFMKEKAISSGGTEKAIRIWKVVEENQLVFRGHSSSIDCVHLFNEDNFISGSQDGSLALWSSLRRKPTALVKNAHPTEDPHRPNWINCVTTWRNSDLAASGSCDGSIKLWQAHSNLDLLVDIPVTGFVNSLCFSSNGKFLLAGVGQEHRLGRWTTVKEARNGIRIIPLNFDD